MTTWDLPLFEALCRTVAHYRALETQIREEGYTGTGSQNQPVKSVFWAARNDAVKQMLQLAARFGLTPADRAGLVVGVGAKPPTVLGPERLLS